MKRIVNAVLVGVAIVAFLLFASCGIETTTSAPGSLKVAFSDTSKTYATVECIQNGVTAGDFVKPEDGDDFFELSDDVRPITLAEARKAGRPDVKCRDAGAFFRRGTLFTDIIGWLRG